MKKKLFIKNIEQIPNQKAYLGLNKTLFVELNFATIYINVNK